MKYAEKQNTVNLDRHEDALRSFLNILRIMLPSFRIPNVFLQCIVTNQTQSNLFFLEKSTPSTTCPEKEAKMPQKNLTKESLRKDAT